MNYGSVIDLVATELTSKGTDPLRTCGMPRSPPMAASWRLSKSDIAQISYELRRRTMFAVSTDLRGQNIAVSRLIQMARRSR